MQIGNITFGNIKNVRKSSDEEGVYFADVEFSEAEGFPMETHIYCVRDNDHAMTGKWVYAQIMTGNFVGGVTQLAPGVNPATGLVDNYQQPRTQGSQDL